MSASTNLLNNGNFEAGVYTSSATLVPYGHVTNSKVPIDWTPSPGFDLPIYNGVFVPGMVQIGNNGADPLASLSQTISTVPQTTYQLSFDLADNISPAGYFDVLVNGIVAVNIVSSIQGTGGSDRIITETFADGHTTTIQNPTAPLLVTVDFTATSTQSTIEFAGANGSASYDISQASVVAPDYINGTAYGFDVLYGNGDPDVITAHGYFNAIYGGTGYDDIIAGSGLAYVSIGTGDATISLSGSMNRVVGKNSNVTVTSSNGSNDSITLGNGNNTVTLSGMNDNVTLGSGKDTVNASDFDTITISGTNLILKGGSDAMLFIKSGPTSIDDQSSGMTAHIGANSGSVSISDVATDANFLIDLSGSGYKTISQVLAALSADGQGGTILAVGRSASIDFVDTSSSVLTASHFKIR